MTAPEPRRGVEDDSTVPGGRAAGAPSPVSAPRGPGAVRRLESAVVGSRALQRLTDLAARLLAADSARVSLLGEVGAVAGGTGLPQDAVGSRTRLDETLCAAVGAAGPGPLVLADVRREPRFAGLLAAVPGAVRAFVGVPLVIADGTFVGVLCVFDHHARTWADDEVALLRELADSVATELELATLAGEFEASRLRFELAIDAAGIGSFDLHVPTGRLRWDERLIELFGYQQEGFAETLEAFEARLHPDDVERVGEAIQRAIATVGVLDVEYRIVLPGGETRWVQGRGRALADDRGATVRLLGAAYDTTAQRDGDARVARVLETMNAAFFALDRDWRFSYVNGEAERLLGKTRDDLVGGDLWELFPHAVGSDFETHYRGAAADGRDRVFEAYYPPPLDAWYEVHAWPGPDGVSVYFIDVTERRRAEERARRSAERLQLIAEVTAGISAALAGDPDADGALRILAGAVVPRQADWSIVSLVDEDGRLRDVASVHVDPARQSEVERYAALRLPALPPAAPLLRALSSGQVVEVRDIAREVGDVLAGEEIRTVYAALAPASALALPLVSRGRTVGALTTYRGGDREPADEQDVATLREVVDRAALALDNARLNEQQRRLAEGLQRSMLTAPPEPDHAEIVVRYLPAVEVAEVGGDWYDAFLQPGGATMLVIGDVVGHDTEAAAAMGQLRGILRGIAFRDGVGPADVLTQLDGAMRGLDVGTMATAAIVRLEQAPAEVAQGVTRVRWSNAGHPPPLVLHDDGRVEALSAGRAELMLGVDADTPRTESVVTLRRGSTVLLYTDGLVEGRDLPLDEGMDRLQAAVAELAHLPLQDLCDGVVTRLRPGALEDDVALVAIRLHPQDRPRPTEAGPAHVPPGVGS